MIDDTFDFFVFGVLFGGKSDFKLDNVIASQEHRVLVFWRIELGHSVVFQHHLLTGARTRRHFDVQRTMYGRDRDVAAKDGFRERELNFRLNVVLVDSFEEVMLLDSHCEEQVAGLRSVDICRVAHLLHLDLLIVLDSSRKLDHFGEHLSLHADSLAGGAEHFGKASSSFALHTSLLYIVVANDAASATALEALAGLGAGSSAQALALRAGYSLVELEVNFGADDCVDEVDFDLCLVVGATGVVSRDTRLRSASLEVEELVEVIEHLLPVLFFGLVGGLGLLRGAALLLLVTPEIALSGHSSPVGTSSPIKVIVLVLFSISLLIVAEDGAVGSPLLVRVVVRETASIAAPRRPEPVLIVVQLLL